MYIREMVQGDAAAVVKIYQAGIDSANATFDTTPPSWRQFDASHRRHHRYLACEGEAVLGWIATAAISQRAAYAGVVEDSIYIAPHARGRGAGHLLLSTLTAATDKAGDIWTIQAGIFPENLASIHLHKRHGFRVVGISERIGRLNGHWRDVVRMERRSTIAGTQ